MLNKSIFVHAARSLRKHREYSRHKGLIHGLCSTTPPPPPPNTEKEGWSSSTDIPLKECSPQPGLQILQTDKWLEERRICPSVRLSSINPAICATPFFFFFFLICSEHCYLQERCFVTMLAALLGSIQATTIGPGS